MSAGVVALPATTDRNEWTPEEAAVIEAAGLVFTHAYGERAGQKVLAPRPVIARFRHTVERTGLDPLARQIYCIGRFGSDGLEWSIQTGIDGFRVIAERSRKYAGQDAAEWLTESGEWVDVFVKALHGDHPLAARVRVYRHDWDPDKPAVGIATWDEYAQTKRNGELTSMWAQRGPGQLAKCAEALALRKAFPHDLSGLYTDDELGNGPTVVEEAGSTSSTGGARPTRVVRTLASRAREAAAATDAPAEEETASDGPTGPENTSPDEVVLFPCARCGRDEAAADEGGICGDCEDAVQAELEAEREAEQ